jgi:hypothetical protein
VHYPTEAVVYNELRVPNSRQELLVTWGQAVAAKAAKAAKASALGLAVKASEDETREVQLKGTPCRLPSAPLASLSALRTAGTPRTAGVAVGVGVGCANGDTGPRSCAAGPASGTRPSAATLGRPPRTGARPALGTITETADVADITPKKLSFADEDTRL